MSPLQLSLLSSHTSLFLWLHASTLGMDTCFDTYFDLAKQLVSKFIGGISVSTSEALMRLQAQSMQGDKAASQQLTEWREEMRDRAFRKGLGVAREHSHTTSLDAVTAKVFRLSKPNFQAITQVSRDRVTFETDPHAFRKEVLRQAQGLYGLRLLSTDWQGWQMPHIEGM